MAFTKPIFLLRFLPLCLLCYWAAPKKLKNAVLVLFSLVFYAWGDLGQLLCLLAIALVSWLAGLGMERWRDKAPGKAAFWVGILGVLGCLGVYKYTGFLFENLRLLGLSLPAVSLAAPAGISFFVFTAASYIWDVKRQQTEVCKNPVDFLLYLTFFPKLLMGPIVRFGDIREQLSGRPVDAAALEQGAVLFVTGLSKKVLLADNIGALWTEVSSLGFDRVSTPLAWLGVAAYSFMLYFDFSGYSDMARGAALFFGFSLPENFKTPYSSHSATEFWRRWHITMGDWFKQYVYIPLGGSRCSAARNTLNLLAVWLLTGLWHGAGWTFLLWGLYYFLLLVLEKRLLLPTLQRHPFAARLYMLPVTAVGWAIFASGTLPQLLLLLRQMFLPASGIGAVYYLRSYAVLLVLCALLCTERAAAIWQRLMQRGVLRVLLLVLLTLLCFAYITDATFTPFLYAQF